jgi:hypothetical protein
MSEFRILHTYKTLAVFISVVLLASACGSSQPSAIATSVAQTVQAGQALTALAGTSAASSAATQTSVAPGPAATLDPAMTPAAAATLVSAPADPNCAKASLVSENPPDKTILTPGQYFWKTWTLQNTGVPGQPCSSWSFGAVTDWVVQFPMLSLMMSHPVKRRILPSICKLPTPAANLQDFGELRLPGSRILAWVNTMNQYQHPLWWAV